MTPGFGRKENETMTAKSAVKQTAVVALGVMLAGVIMYQFRDVGVINMARSGYDM